MELQVSLNNFEMRPKHSLGGGASEIKEVVWICEEPKAKVSFHTASSISEASHQSERSLNMLHHSILHK